jgi:hypothetical protein
LLQNSYKCRVTVVTRKYNFLNIPEFGVQGGNMKTLALSTILLVSGVAFAKADTAVKRAESAMMSACKKEYPAEVKGKKFKEVADWVETEERGANKDKFTKSKCYNLHEDWEKVAGKSEEGEANGHKE